MWWSLWRHVTLARAISIDVHIWFDEGNQQAEQGGPRPSEISAFAEGPHHRQRQPERPCQSPCYPKQSTKVIRSNYQFKPIMTFTIKYIIEMKSSNDLTYLTTLSNKCLEKP